MNLLYVFSLNLFQQFVETKENYETNLVFSIKNESTKTKNRLIKINK